jgi:hypothetical protein
MLTSIRPGVSQDRALTRTIWRPAPRRSRRPAELYRGRVSGSSFSPDEIRASAEVHRELGPDYSAAVIESFLDKVGREIDARVDARLAAAQPAAQPAVKQSPAAPASQAQGPASSGRSAVAPIAVFSLIAGIPLTAIDLARPAGLTGLLIIWIAIAVINVAYALAHSVRPGR